MYSITKTHVLSLTILVFSLLSLAEADSATCESGWEWSYNSKGQDPCAIAELLQASCMGYAGYILPPLAQGDTYMPPAEDDNKGQECGCNTVIYGLYMACTACQNCTFQTWSDWDRKCYDGVYVTEYPFDVSTPVPHWAYLNYTDQFDPDLAKAAGRDPEVTPRVPSTVSLPSSTTPTTSVILSTPSNPVFSGGNESESKTNVGAIAGGVVGGIAVLVVFGAAVFFFLKRRRGQHDRVSGLDSDQEYRTGANVREFNRGRLYDPSDPSTYPGTRLEDDYFGENNSTTIHRSGRYTGAAEL